MHRTLSLKKKNETIKVTVMIDLFHVKSEVSLRSEYVEQNRDARLVGVYYYKWPYYFFLLIFAKQIK